ncbi:MULTISPECIES: hypothetical protein [unclassified Anabaena]|uniref:hypothetical protein n=1 Tax=unclassified Anabaena TaxID=2619674 RepID=UPI0039C74672
MEHWQFLIQKQGDRSWHTLESPNLEILEGRYRVLARSNLPNTDVEIRVTHSSTQEIPPKRRIQKRSRRTNSEGLMAVIPFTHLKPGIWELQCSGDLMSDLFGQSWQYSINLQVLSQEAYETRERLSKTESIESNSLHIVDGELIAPVTVYNDSNSATIADEELISPVTVYNDSNSATIADEELIAPVTAYNDSNSATIADEELIAPVTVYNDINSATIADEELIAPVTVYSESESATTDLSTQIEEGSAVNDQPVSPVWLKGETAEQILQNLMDLALPTVETLLEHEELEDSSVVQPPPPLLLTLDREIYIARWGEKLTINGHVELQNQVNGEDETPYPENLYALKLLIELRSPLESEILTLVRQPLPNSSLPFNISSVINIPIHCESKLILADMRLYGSLTDVDEIVLLASKSFTITADVTELLAITAAAKSSYLNFLDSSSASPNSADESTVPERTMSIDLGLFNLVKTSPKDASGLLETSALSHSQPPQIKPREIAEASLPVSEIQKAADSRLPQLPKLPENQSTAKTALTTGLAIDDVNLSVSLESAPREKNENLTPLAPINLAQLVIRDHRVTMLSSTFPYLKRVKAASNTQVEEDNSTANALDTAAVEESLQTDTPILEDENQLKLSPPELVPDDTEYPDASEPEITASASVELSNELESEVTSPASLPLTTEGNIYSSPLIRKWMHSQASSLPESIIDVLHQQRIPDEQMPLSSPPVDVDSLLNLEEETESTVDAIAAEVQETEIPEVAETEILADVDAENNLLEETAASPPPVPELASAVHPPTPSAWLAQEFVVDDTYTIEAADLTVSGTSQQQEQANSDLSPPLLEGGIVEPLPIPQMHVPDGELVAGKSVRVRIELPAVPPQVAIKLWVEDCQTRWLLDGPHVLTDLLPQPAGDVEVMTQLNIPFGCLEIRLEAIAFHQVTQQESHKVTVVRTVIPPDLPNLRLDELLGM